MRTVNWTVICVLGALVLATWASAQSEFVDYPEFRYTSALPGGGWGVTPDGLPGFDGAIQTNIPVAYTPYTGIILGYASGSYDSTPQFGLSGGDVNGTATIAMGFGSSGHGIYACEMGTSNEWEPAENLQYQVLAASESRPAVAIGVVDILSQRDRRVTVRLRIVGLCGNSAGHGFHLQCVQARHALCGTNQYHNTCQVKKPNPYTPLFYHQVLTV